MALSDSRRGPPLSQRRRGRDPRPRRVSPDYPHHLSGVPCPLPRRTKRVLMSIPSPSTRPSPLFRRVGVRTFTFEACSGFTRVTARRIAQPPKAAFVTRLRPGRLPSQIARQLPDQSTTLWVESSSTGDTRLRGARRVEEERGCLGHAATLRFSSPLIKPDVPISGIRLSDRLHCEAHGGGPTCTRRRCNTPSVPNTTS
jgi:hypothetical protein